MGDRNFAVTDRIFVPRGSVAAERLAAVEAGQIKGLVTVKTLMATAKMVMLESFREAGVTDPPHRHDDHETMCYLQSGRLRVFIGEESFVAEPGDSWFHPVGVMHYAEALEDSVQVEVKVPPVKTW